MEKDKKYKILCIDDEPGILEALNRLLWKDYQLIYAEGPHKGIELLKQHDDISVVITDFRMPEMTGVDVLKEVQKISPTSARILLSGQIDLVDLAEVVNTELVHRVILKTWENDFLKIQISECTQIHERLCENKKLRKQAITDPVTDLPNHRHFQETLYVEMKKSKEGCYPLSLIMLDVDHFKKVNDQFGHPEGDSVLYAMGQLIKQVTLGKGLVFRYGGEEFAVVLPRWDVSGALGEAEALCRAVMDNTFLINRKSHRLTISCGVAGNSQFTEPGELIEGADRALYEAKDKGRNCVRPAAINS